jgi:hypothetical protein
MRELLEDYKRRLKTINEELKITIDEATDITKITRLTIKRGDYRTFISELERIIPAAKPVDPKIAEAEKKAKEAEEKEYQDKKDDWNRRMIAGEFELEAPKEENPFE